MQKVKNPNIKVIATIGFLKNSYMYLKTSSFMISLLCKIELPEILEVLLGRNYKRKVLKNSIFI